MPEHLHFSGLLTEMLGCLNRSTSHERSGILTLSIDGQSRSSISDALEIHNSRPLTKRLNNAFERTLEVLSYDPRGHVTAVASKKGGGQEGVCLAWFVLHLISFDGLSEFLYPKSHKRTSKIVRKETPFPKNHFRVYV